MTDFSVIFHVKTCRVSIPCELRKGKIVATGQNLEKMKLSELKDLAKQMGLRGTSTMRKPELVATLTAARNGGEAPAGVSVRVPRDVVNANKTADTSTDIEDVRSSKDNSDLEALEVLVPNAASDRRYRDEEDFGNKNYRRDANRNNTFQRRRSSEDRNDNRDRREDGMDSHELDQILATLPGEDSHAEGEPRRQRVASRDFDREEQQNRADRFQRRMRGRARDYDESRSDYSDRQNHSERMNRVEREDRDERRAERGERQDCNDRNVRLDRDARDAREEHDLRESRREESQEELVPVAGIVDVLESYAFVRTSGYLPGPNDVYVSMSQIKKYGLRKGDAVQGSIRAPREGDRRNQRQKFVPLQTIDSINGMSVEEAQSRPQFAKLTPLYPQERLKQETTPNRMLGRVIDLVAPIGKGQRGLIVSPPKAGKTITLQNIASAITTNNPEVHLMVVLVDERPEEVTDMERTVQGEVISSTFDRPATDHTTVAELAIERAKRLVELGQDVVVLLDSMTRLARAYNIAAPTSGRILSGGVDAQALYPPKKFFGAARNIEDGGSLTIISSALVETGSKMDEVIFEEFKGTGNMELRLSRDLADKRLFPAVDINASGTRREELITPAADLPVIYRLRRLFGGLEAEQAYQTLIPRLKKTASNRDFLAAITQQTGTATNNSSSTTIA